MKQRIANVALALLVAACVAVVGCAQAAENAKPAAVKVKVKAKAKAKAKAKVKAKAEVSPPVFATVGGTVITFDEYDIAFNAAARGKFYHGKPPEGGIALLQREVGDRLVTRVLLLREAKLRGLQPDQESVRNTLDGYEKRYADSEQWKKDREQALPSLKKQLEEKSLLEQLEKAVRESVVSSPEQVAGYYAAHLDKFTEPEQLHLKVILLKVDPSSSKEVWEKAEQDAQDVIKQLRGGADFAELARQRSGDAESAQQGGDLGYRHSGMLPEDVMGVLNGLKPGELSPSVATLQGYAVFLLADRKLPKLVEFDASRERAEKLLLRELRDTEWKALADRLKKETPPKIDETHYQPLFNQPASAVPPTP